MGRRDGDTHGPHDAREPTVRHPAEPPGSGDADETDDDGNDAGRTVRRLVEADLRRAQDEEEEARIVVPPRVEAAAVDELPGARDEVLLVRVEERQRQPRPRAHHAQRRREREDRGEDRQLDDRRRAAAAAPDAGVSGCAQTSGTASPTSASTSPVTRTASTPARSSSSTSSREAPASSAIASLPAGTSGSSSSRRSSGACAVFRAFGGQQHDLGVDLVERAHQLLVVADPQHVFDPELLTALDLPGQRLVSFARGEHDRIRLAGRRSVGRGPVREEGKRGLRTKPRLEPRGPPGPRRRPPRPRAPPLRREPRRGREIPSPSAIAWLNRRPVTRADGRGSIPGGRARSCVRAVGRVGGVGSRGGVRREARLPARRRVHGQDDAGSQAGGALRDRLESRVRPAVHADRSARGRSWTSWEFTHIARIHCWYEDFLATSANRVLFTDTDAFTTALFHEVYLGGPATGFEELVARPYDLFVVCGLDVPWRHDGIREFEAQRRWMHERYLERARSSGKPWLLAEGALDARLRAAASAVDACLRATLTRAVGRAACAPGARATFDADGVRAR